MCLGINVSLTSCYPPVQQPGGDSESGDHTVPRDLLCPSPGGLEPVLGLGRICPELLEEGGHRTLTLPKHVRTSTTLLPPWVNPQSCLRWRTGFAIEIRHGRRLMFISDTLVDWNWRERPSCSQSVGLALYPRSPAGAPPQKAESHVCGSIPNN